MLVIMRRFLQQPTVQAVRRSHASHWVGRRLATLCILVLSVSTLWAQQTVSGVVKAGDSALANVSVAVKGAKTGVMTNDAGEFSLSAPAGATLVFSRVGFTTKTIAVPAGGRIDLQLEYSNDNLGEVVVVGYGTQKWGAVLHWQHQIYARNAAYGNTLWLNAYVKF